MPYLADTNVLLRLAVPTATDHFLVRTAVRSLRQQGERLYYAPQNLVEFWNVCTRPPSARGGLGLTVSDTDWAARIVERVFTLLPENTAIHTEWRRLVVTFGVSGVRVHDARLVAAMRVHGLARLLTFDVADFQRYPGIVAVHPASVR